MSHDLRLGRWQDVMSDVLCDSLITDPPYSERTHAGFRSGGVSAGSIGEQAGIIEYPPLTEDAVKEFVDSWRPRVKNWWVIFGDHITQAWWASTLEAAGLYVFAPVAWIRRDAPPRFSGDGPQRSAEWITVARPRARTSCGSLPGYYLVNRVEGATNGSRMPGQKNLNGMRAVVRDYSEVGDLVADPYGGTSTTARACVRESRNCVTAEADAGRHAIAVELTSAPFTPSLLPYL